MLCGPRGSGANRGSHERAHQPKRQGEAGVLRRAGHIHDARCEGAHLPGHHRGREHASRGEQRKRLGYIVLGSSFIGFGAG